MRKNVRSKSRRCVALLVVAATSVSLGCGTGATGKARTMMLSDDDRMRAQGGVIHVREQPAFPLDARQRPLAVLDDGEEVRGADRPSGPDRAPRRLQERKP
jgi:hypothetical protein